MRFTYRTYLLTVLLIVGSSSMVDRIALGLVLQDIKHDLSLSDAQLGFMGGIAFAFFYAILGIPIARWADRGNRVTIIAVTSALWSAAVALCGMAGNFLQLMLIRTMAGVGEAGCVPPALSLIADFYTRPERPRALSVYMQRMPLSLLIGYCLAGWFNQFFGWRMMFVMIGLPGLALAALAWLSLKEPRKDKLGTLTPASLHPTLREVCATLWTNTTFRHLMYAYSVLFFFLYGSLQWTPAFFVRSFGMQTGALGTWFAIVYGIGSLVGTYGFGEWAARRAADNEPLQLRTMALAIGFSGLFSALVYIPIAAPNYYWALGWLGLSTAAGSIHGPAFALIQTLVPPRMRAMAIAVVYLFANLVGMGLGPWAVGLMSDAFRPWAGDESLRYALLALSPGYCWVGWHLWRAGRTVIRDLEGSGFTASSDIPAQVQLRPGVSNG